MHLIPVKALSCHDRVNLIEDACGNSLWFVLFLFKDYFLDYFFFFNAVSVIFV